MLAKFCSGIVVKCLTAACKISEIQLCAVCVVITKNTAIYSLDTPTAVQCRSEFNFGKWWVRMIAADRHR